MCLRARTGARGWVSVWGECVADCAGMSSLDAKDAVADYSSLNESQMQTLNQWESFFEKVRARAAVCADGRSGTASWGGSCSSVCTRGRLVGSFDACRSVQTKEGIKHPAHI